MFSVMYLQTKKGRTEPVMVEKGLFPPGRYKRVGEVEV